MAKQFSDIDRRAIWEAHGKRCAYCGDPLQFRTLFIDHVIPQSASGAPLDDLLQRCGLPNTFDIHSDLNLVPSCRRCNLLKGDKLFEPPKLILILELARSKTSKVGDLRTRYESEEHADAARIALSLAIAKGAVSLDEAEHWLSELGNQNGHFRLQQEIRLGDGKALQRISKVDVNQLLDTPIEVNRGHEESLELVHDNGSKRSVRTCREYQRAIDEGFYPYTTYAIKIASDFKIPLAIFKAIQSSSVPEKSYVRSPRVGVTDLHLMPITLAPGLSWAPEEDKMAAFEGKNSLQDLVNDGTIRICRANQGLIVLETEDSGCLYMELIRTDITGDGTEDILVFSYDYATRGTFGVGNTGILRRSTDGAMFTWDSETLSARSAC